MTGVQTCALPIWKKMVTKRRGEYSRRLKSARPTNAKECLSSGIWPSPNCADVYTDNLKSSQQKQGSMHSVTLPQAIKKNWPTVTVNESKNSTGKSQVERNSPPLGTAVLGHQAQVKHSTNGSLPGLFPTPRSSDAEGGRIETEITDDGFRSKRKASNQYFGAKLRDAVETMASNNNWNTPDCSDRRSSKSKQQGLSNQVKDNWSTPRVGGQEKGSTRLARGKDLGLQGQCEVQSSSGKLNPRWVETLQGIPVGWVMPSCDSLNEPQYYGIYDNRTDELRMLGNGVVPATAAKAWVVLNKQSMED